MSRLHIKRLTEFSLTRAHMTTQRYNSKAFELETSQKRAKTNDITIIILMILKKWCLQKVENKESNPVQDGGSFDTHLLIAILSFCTERLLS